MLLFCGHHTSNMAFSSYTPRCVAIIPYTWPPRVMLLVLWPPFLKHDFLDLSSFFCGHHTCGQHPQTWLLDLYSSFVAIIPQTWTSSSYTLRFVAIIPQTMPPRVMLFLWPPYLKHGLLELYSSFCDHHSSNMASSIYTPSFVAIIPQTWPPRDILLVLWPLYLTHGLLELYSSLCGHHTSN